MVLFGVFFAIWRVSFHSGLLNLCSSYQPFQKELGRPTARKCDLGIVFLPFSYLVQCSLYSKGLQV